MNQEEIWNCHVDLCQLLQRAEITDHDDGEVRITWASGGLSAPLARVLREIKED